MLIWPCFQIDGKLLLLLTCECGRRGRRGRRDAHTNKFPAKTQYRYQIQIYNYTKCSKIDHVNWCLSSDNGCFMKLG